MSTSQKFIEDIIIQQGISYLKIPTNSICTNQESYKDKPELKKETIVCFSSTEIHWAEYSTEIHWAEYSFPKNDETALNDFKCHFIHWKNDITKTGGSINKFYFEYFKTDEIYMRFKIKLWYHKAIKYLIPV